MANTDSPPVPKLFKRLTDLDAAWKTRQAGDRLDAVRKGARALNETIKASGTVVSVTTFDISSLPYPALFGLMGADKGIAPHVIMKNRMQLVQVDAGGRLVNILVNPTDPERAQAAPFIAKQLASYPELLNKVLKRQLIHSSVEASLRSAGVAPEDIDYITFDHLHVQDVRGLLGTAEIPALLPNARLIAQSAELALFENMHPMHHYWYVRDCITGIAKDKFITIDGDYAIGGGFALVRTPGHTDGNHSPAINTDTGVWTVSENGIAAECYAPEHSRNNKLRRFARHYEVEVILNGNTRENTHDQYTSMVLEKTLADPSALRPEFPQTFPSSELQHSALAPGIKPTFQHGAITHGTVQQKASYSARQTAA
jgi:glyoxylase-like metal-dependent hydrolase (beta-lactamase superfamily II)